VEAKEDLVLQFLKTCESWEGLLTRSTREFNRQALDQILALGPRTEGNPFAERVIETLASWKSNVPRYPSIPTRLDAIDGEVQCRRNLIGAYYRFYANFSSFVHSSGALTHVVEFEGERVGLSKGTLKGHFTPLLTALLFMPDFLTRYDDCFECGFFDQVTRLAQLRSSLLGEMSLAEDE
jgi:hypothetical protein